MRRSKRTSSPESDDTSPPPTSSGTIVISNPAARTYTCRSTPTSSSLVAFRSVIR
jgi:hypothetical protein